MPDPRQLSDQEAARRRHIWLEERHAQARELVVLLLRHAPEEDVARALDQLPDGELQHLARLLAHATDVQHRQDGGQDHHDTGQPGPSAVTRRRP